MNDQVEVSAEIEAKAVKLTQALDYRLKSDKADRERMARNARLLSNKAFHALCAQLESIPAWKIEVKAVNFWMWDSRTVELNISLNSELANPQLPRELVRNGFASSLRKRKGWNGASLIVEGALIAPKVPFKVKVEITGYVPATCQVVYEEVQVPAKVERRAKIVCDPNTSPQTPDESAVEGTITAEG